MEGKDPEDIQDYLRPGTELAEDGKIGGFNFQWAWASGYCAGTSL